MKARRRGMQKKREIRTGVPIPPRLELGAATGHSYSDCMGNNVDLTDEEDGELQEFLKRHPGLIVQKTIPEIVIRIRTQKRGEAVKKLDLIIESLMNDNDVVVRFFTKLRARLPEGKTVGEAFTPDQLAEEFADAALESGKLPPEYVKYATKKALIREIAASDREAKPRRRKETAQ